jgi:16S rRNA (cytidine1402-2'-O)-methyltransferase
MMGSRTISGDTERRGRQPSDAPGPSKPTEDGETVAATIPPGLHLVATPIGNAGDLSFRALDVLRAVDLVACEDTRVTGRLLARHGIATRRLPYHDHNAERARPVLLQRLRRGERVALVSDAGTPLVSDPGYKLVRAAIEDGIPVTAVPGPSALLAALAIAGLPTDRFMFCGFLPPKSAARRSELTALAQVPATLVFYESARRLADSLVDMAAFLGDRPAAVARELTKFYEEVRRGGLAELAAHYAEAGAPKGEIVVVVGPPLAARAASDEALDAALDEALKDLSPSRAAAEVAELLNIPRKRAYARALERSK